MNSDERATFPSQYLGWLVIAGAIGQVPLIVLMSGAYSGRMAADTASLGVLAVAAVILLIAGIGLALGRQFGYYALYLSAVFNGIAGVRVPYIPFLHRWLALGPATSDFILAVNFLVLAYVAWEHFQRVYTFSPVHSRGQRVAIVVLMTAAATSMMYARTLESRSAGQAANVSDLPTVGPLLGDLTAIGPVDFVGVHTKRQNGISIIFSGKTQITNAQHFAQLHDLKLMTNAEAHAKFIPQARGWKLNTNQFPTRFGPDDYYYVGRLRDARKVSVQLIARKQDGRFTAQVFGVMPTEKEAGEDKAE